MDLNNLFGGKKEIKSLSAIKDIAADKITAEQLTALNTEFAELGFEGVEIVHSGASEKAIADLKTANDKVTAAEEKATKAEADLKDATDKVTSLEAKLKATPAAKTEEPVVKKDEIITGEKEEAVNEKMTSNFRKEHGLPN